MAQDFTLLEMAQLEAMHETLHTMDAENCIEARQEHDAIAAELVRRGMEHDSEFVCEEQENIIAAPNYRRSFAHEGCVNCVFGPVNQFCQLYDFEYAKDYICDSWQTMEIIEVELPHGFLMWRGKQTAIANDTPLVEEKPHLIVSGGDAYGIATLGQAITMKSQEFDRREWMDQHCVYPRERREWWPEAESLYVHRITDWKPFESSKTFENGKVVDEPEPSPKQKSLIHRSKQLPKILTLVPDVVQVTADRKFILDKVIEALALSEKTEDLQKALQATYDHEIEFVPDARTVIPIYSLALVRNSKIKVLKKSEAEKQEEGAMPWEIQKRGDEYCVIKIDDGENEGCHASRAEAEDQLTALNIAESERGIYDGDDKPKRRRRRKKEGPGLIEKFKQAYTDLLHWLDNDNTEETWPIDFSQDSGLGIKTVNGELWHFTWSTNAFEDREGEIFSTKALERYVAESEKKPHRGFFNLWHINQDNCGINTDFAEKQWQGVVGRFLVEAGPYLDNTHGQAAKEFFSKHSDGHPNIAPEGWGCSPEFRYLPEERANKVYEWLWITRTSTLPRAAAANIWTEAKQSEKIMTLSEQQKQAAVEIFGKEMVDRMLAEGGQKTEDLESADIAYKDGDQKKEATTEEPTTETKAPEIDYETLAVEVGKAFVANNAPMVNQMVEIAEQLKAVGERVAKLEETKEVTEAPRFVYEMKRASEAEETEIDQKADQNEQPETIQKKLSADGASHFFSSK